MLRRSMRIAYQTVTCELTATISQSALSAPSSDASQRGLAQMIAGPFDNEAIEFGCGCPRTNAALSACAWIRVDQT
jgi:hypothetical protein